MRDLHGEVVPLETRGIYTLLIIAVFGVILLAGGCREPSVDTGPPDLYDGYEHWFTLPLHESQVEVYASRSGQKARYTELVFWFANYFPGDPRDASFRLLLHRADGDVIRGGICDHQPDFDEEFHLYTAMIAPETDGQWTLECAWTEGGATWRGAHTFTIPQPPTHSRVLQDSLGGPYYVWVRPDTLRLGTQEFEVEVWNDNRPELTYDRVPDLDLLVDAFVLPGEPVGETDTLLQSGSRPGRYSGTISIPSAGSWTVSIHEETVPMESGIHFIFDVVDDSDGGDNNSTDSESGPARW